MFTYSTSRFPIHTLKYSIRIYFLGIWWYNLSVFFKTFDEKLPKTKRIPICLEFLWLIIEETQFESVCQVHLQSRDPGRKFCFKAFISASQKCCIWLRIFLHEAEILLRSNWWSRWISYCLNSRNMARNHLKNKKTAFHVENGNGNFTESLTQTK